ncbi:MAG: hypothetical protein QM692_16190 [Thermomicrobiales bacterium]
MPDRRFLRFTPLLLTLALAGCGAMPEPTPAPAPPATTATVESSPAASSPTAKLTLGALAQRVEKAWGNVESYRLVITGDLATLPNASPVAGAMATPGATPVTAGASPAVTGGHYVITRDIILPDLQQVTVTGVLNMELDAVADGETVYARGALAQQLDPVVDADTWVTIAAADIPPHSVLEGRLVGLPVLPMPPLSALPDRLLAQTVREMGEAEVAGRTCQTYGAADTDVNTGQRLDFIFGIDEDDLPCFIETRVGTTTYGHQEYSMFNQIAAIDVPPAGTPFAIPPALAAEAHHD